jgi:hypothetical protein
VLLGADDVSGELTSLVRREPMDIESSEWAKNYERYLVPLGISQHLCDGIVW